MTFPIQYPEQTPGLLVGGVLSFCVRAFHETDFCCSRLAHEVEVAFVVSVAEGFGAVEDGTPLTTSSSAGRYIAQKCLYHF